MARHNEITETFKESIQDFDFENSEHITMVIISIQLEHAITTVIVFTHI